VAEILPKRVSRGVFLAFLVWRGSSNAKRSDFATPNAKRRETPHTKRILPQCDTAKRENPGVQLQKGEARSDGIA
jgi:hypothetical protein